MASKEAVMMCVDAGNSMDEMYSEDASRLKLSMDCVTITLQQKTFSNSNHEVGFAIFGDADAGEEDDNYLLLQPISKPNVQLLRKIDQLSQAKLDNAKPGGDIFRAIKSCIEQLQRHCGKKKFNAKRIFLFTNGMGETVYNEQTIKSLALELRVVDVKLNIIPINFMEGYVLQENQVESQITNMQQLVNAQLLMDLKADAQDNIQIFPDQIAIELYKKFRKREVNPVALFKGQLQLAPDLSIEVETYKMVRRERLKSLAKYDVNQPFNPLLDKTKEITTKISYIIQGDEANVQIERQNQMNSYLYGPHLIPISDILEREAKFQEKKNFKILAFVDKQYIKREAFLGEVESIVPKKKERKEKEKYETAFTADPHLQGQKLFTALVYSMLSLNKYAIARYVPRDNKNGVIPRLVVLIPYRGVNREALYLIDLPTVQDVRDYPFNSLKKASQRQCELVRDMVVRMQLYKRNDEEDIEQLKIENTFNPTIQYFFQTVFHRAIKDQGQIPKLNQNISRYLHPEDRIFQETQELIKQTKKEFKFIRKELSKERVAKKQALMWKDIIEDQMPSTEDNKSLHSSETGEELKPHKMFSPEQDDNQNFDPSKPVLSFTRMISNNKVDLVDKALKQMTLFIDQKSKDPLSHTDEGINHLLTCASALRKACDEQQEKEFWDDWLDTAKEGIPQKLYRKIISEGYGFFKHANGGLYKSTDLHTFKADVEPQFGDLD